MNTKSQCPLCRNTAGFKHFDGQDQRIYLCCPECRLVFVDKESLPDPEFEKHRYLEHNNGIEYPGYVKFLNRAIEPALPYLQPESYGIDFGCGHVPTLSILMERMGHKCENYDPFFFPALPEGPFDYVFATECFEHFFYPAKELKLISGILKKDGLLTIMTRFWKEEGDILTHFYFRDPSHVVFYHEDTINWIARKLGFRIIFTDNEQVVVLRKTN